MKVLVGIIANQAGRFSEFSACVTKLLVPQGSTKEWLIGGDWCGARNELAKRCLDEGYDYLWFMDDDHSFAPDLLQRLLAHELPLVNPLCLARIAPFPLVTYAENPDKDDPLRYLPINLDGAPEEGLVELEAGGCAGMLIRRDVLEATRNWASKWDAEKDRFVEDPDRWFEYGDKSEDIVFCEKAKRAGFTLYADLACRLGHITTAVVWPAVQDGEWVTGVTVGGNLDLVVPRAEFLVPAEEPTEAEFVADETIENTVAEPSQSVAERIEIWIDEEFRWWWRGIGHDGAILRKDSGTTEQSVIGQAHLFYPDVEVHQIRDESQDSRNLRPYRVGGRWVDRR
jgi:hypothetical protein